MPLRSAPTWWAWTLTAVLLTIGLFGHPSAFVAGMGVTGFQAIVMLIREKSVSAFPVQLRIAYLMLLGICFIPQYAMAVLASASWNVCAGDLWLLPDGSSAFTASVEPPGGSFC